jgi:hypothetical protein
MHGRMWAALVVVGAVVGEQDPRFVQRRLLRERQLLAQGAMHALIPAVRLRVMRVVRASNSLDIHVSSAGNVRYFGAPRLTQQIGGIGSVTKGGD